MSASNRSAPNDVPADDAPAEPQRGRMLLSWKLWLGMLFVGLAAIAFVAALPVYRRMQAFEYFDAHDIEYDLTADNEWLAERLGRWGRGLRRVKSIRPIRIDDESAIPHITEFQETKAFHCYGGIPLSKTSIESLSSLIHVEELTLGNANFTDELLARWFANRPPLRKVTLVRSAISGEGLRELSRIQTLAEMYLFGTSLTETNFRDLAPMPNLQTLAVDEGAIGEQGGRWISSMPGLRSLYFDQVNATPEFWSHLRGLNRMEFFACRKMRIPASGLQAISLLGGVTELDFETSSLDSAGIEHIGRMTQLTTLSFEDCAGLSDAGVMNIGKLTSLESLKLAGCTGLTEACVAHLEGLPNLTFLSLPPETITYASIESLRKIPNLDNVGVEYVDLANDELKQIMREEW